jgi:glycosyltransferase involved in cell wall biosynthesis
MKVLHLASFPTMTGPADPALGLARAQLAYGWDVAIAIDCLRKGNMRAKVEAAGVRLVEGLELSTKSSPAAIVRDAARMRKLTAEFDVVHAHASHDHALAAFSSRGRILVRSIHHPRGARRRGLQGVAYARTDGFIVPAQAHRRLLLENYDVPHVIVVPGAVDERRFHPGVDGAGVRAERGIDPSAFVIGMIARIKPGRGQEALLDAFAPLADRAVLVFIGKGEGEPALDAAIEARGLGGAVRRYGFRDEDLPQAIASCDVTVLLEEGNDAGCRAVLESMASGVPVIGADHPAIAEALDGVGTIVPAGDADALTAALEATVARDDLEAAGRAARARIEARHTDAIRAEVVAAFYERLVESKR